jgi:hypothetical protein
MWTLAHCHIIHRRYMLPGFIIGPWYVRPPKEWVDGASPAYMRPGYPSQSIRQSAIRIMSKVISEIP